MGRLGWNIDKQFWAGCWDFFTPGSDLVQAFVANGATATPITLPAGSTYIYAYGINESGQVTGNTGANPGILGAATERAYIGTAAGVNLIPLPAGWTYSGGYGINRYGQVTGIGGSATTSGSFIGTLAGSTVIPGPAGWDSHAALAINDFGTVAGVGVNGGFGQVFVYGTAGITIIPRPPGASSAFLWVIGNSINNNGTVVGMRDVGGWVWNSSQGTVLLNNLVPAGWNISATYGINNNGVIAARATFNGGAPQMVELVPALPGTPAPSTLALLLTGLACCGLWVRWRAARS